MQARGIPQEYWDTFRAVVFSMSGQVFLLFTTLILLCLDLRGSVLIISSVFLATNLGFAVLTILLGHQYYGYSFLASPSLACSPRSFCSPSDSRSSSTSLSCASLYKTGSGFGPEHLRIWFEI